MNVSVFAAGFLGEFSLTVAPDAGAKTIGPSRKT